MSSKESKSEEFPVFLIGEAIIFVLLLIVAVWYIVSQVQKMPATRIPTVQQKVPISDPLLEGRELVTVFPGWELPIGERVMMQRILPYDGADVTSASYEVVGIAP